LDAASTDLIQQLNPIAQTHTPTAAPPPSQKFGIQLQRAANYDQFGEKRIEAEE
jgi:hypothetical protein